MSYKRKNIILLIGFLLSLPLLYYISFSDTIQYKNEYEKLLKEKESAQNLSSSLLTAKQEGRYIDSILRNKNILLNNSFQQILLKSINRHRLENNIEIVEFRDFVEVTDNAIRSQIYPIVVKGNFNALLKFLNYFEQQGLGEIKSYKFKRKRDFSKRKDYLVLELLFKRVLSD